MLKNDSRKQRVHITDLIDAVFREYIFGNKCVFL